MTEHPKYQKKYNGYIPNVGNTAANQWSLRAMKEKQMDMSTGAKATRREEAEARNNKFSNMTIDEKIAKIKAAPGESKKQMARLLKEKANAKG